jgi:hypothetical protein
VVCAVPPREAAGVDTRSLPHPDGAMLCARRAAGARPATGARS